MCIIIYMTKCMVLNASIPIKDLQPATQWLLTFALYMVFNILVAKQLLTNTHAITCNCNIKVLIK